MLGEVVCRSPEAIFDLNGNETHPDDMAKRGTLSSLLTGYTKGRRHTPANTTHQSFHPTLLTSHILVAKRNAINMSTVLRASTDVASNPPKLSALPISGGEVGFCMIRYTKSITDEDGNRQKLGCKVEMTVLSFSKLPEVVTWTRK